MERRRIHDFPAYTVNEHGMVYRDGREKPLAQVPNEKGYLLVGLWHDGKSCRRFVHKIVLEAFVGPKTNGMQAAHKDGNPKNNHFSNLEWVTPLINESHKVKHGTAPIGERNGRSKLTEDQVLMLRRAKASAGSEWNVKKFAREFGVNATTIIKAASSQHWTHIAAPPLSSEQQAEKGEGA